MKSIEKSTETERTDKPVRRSYSQLSGYVACGKRFQLERRVKVASRPGWWACGGLAVHATIERYLLAQALREKADRENSV